MSVHTVTGMYHFEVSRTAMSPEACMPGCTCTNCLVPPCNPFMIGLDSAYVQESAIWYIHCLEAYIQADVYLHFMLVAEVFSVHVMYIPGTYIKCTNSYVFAHILDQQKVTYGED